MQQLTDLMSRAVAEGRDADIKDRNVMSEGIACAYMVEEPGGVRTLRAMGK